MQTSLIIESNDSGKEKLESLLREDRGAKE